MNYLLILSISICLVSVFLMWRGAIYVPTESDRVSQMIKLARVNSGEKALDIGSGDGRIVIALAKAGAEAHGYELNPVLVIKSRRNIRLARLEHKAFIHWKDFWDEDLSAFSIITVYGIPYIMSRLERKLSSELPEGARILSNNFKFPGLRPTEVDGKVTLYVKS